MSPLRLQDTANLEVMPSDSHSLERGRYAWATVSLFTETHSFLNILIFPGYSANGEVSTEQSVF